MNFDDETSEVVFSSGRRRYHHAKIFGLAPDMEISYGYDGHFYSGQEGEEWRDDEEPLTREDIAELADYMIEQWTKFRKQLP